MTCIHDQRTRYTHGFFCDDCHTFFGEDSPTYRSDELLSSIWMVLHNINVKRFRASLPIDQEIADLKEEIGIDKKHDNYEDMIKRAEIAMKKHAVSSESASLVLS